ncbi:hypothetical protein pb186bvf_020866 [Paramecium bursaria]
MKYSLISIEGNIGSGKSTLLRLLKQRYPDLRYVPEPVNEWQSIGGDPQLNLLAQFYSDPTRWAYTMQIYAFYSRLKHWKEELKSQNPEESVRILSERSIQADKEIFATNGFKNGLITKLEFAVYEQFYEWLVKEIFYEAVKEQYIIYLRVNPLICNDRIQKRGRDEEKTTIKLDYLEQIHQRHEEWLLGNPKAKVLILDGDMEFESNQDRQEFLFEQINEFIQK